MKFSLFLVLLITTIGSIAQTMLDEKRDTAKINEKNSFGRVSLGYSSDYYYMGRSDSARAPYLTLSSGYYHKSGFFARGSISYLAAKEDSRIDLYTITGGYEYSRKKLFSGISLSGYFFAGKSYSVQSEMNAYLNAYAAYDFYIVTFIVDAGAGFSEDTDIFFGTEINHAFYTIKDKLRIIPSIYVGAGTQHYYDQYYSQRSVSTGKGKGKGNGAGWSSDIGQPGLSQLHTRESEKFKILNYEISVEISYKIRQLRFLFVPTWTFPVNPSTIVMDGVSYEEHIGNGFYWWTGIRYTIY